jgi:hypothetical protein
MFVTMTRVATSDEPIENAAIVAEEMTRWLREIDGFEGMLVLSREVTSVGLTFWVDRDVAERHRTVRMEFLDKVTAVAGVEVEESVDYEVMFASLSERLRDIGIA